MVVCLFIRLKYPFKHSPYLRHLGRQEFSSVPALLLNVVQYEDEERELVMRPQRFGFFAGSLEVACSLVHGPLEVG